MHIRVGKTTTEPLSVLNRRLAVFILLIEKRRIQGVRWMYEYRKMTPAQKKETVAARRARGLPLHQLPHLIVDANYYLLTATCFEHQQFLQSPERRQELLQSIHEAFALAEFTIFAWVILPNHYHLLAHVPRFGLLRHLFRKIHGRTSYEWNCTDDCQGRRIWYQYQDRAIRSERHFYTTMNYIHYNPVKHGYAASPYEWKDSSVHTYLETEGREFLQDLWRAYPVREYGNGWDD